MKNTKSNSRTRRFYVLVVLFFAAFYASAQMASQGSNIYQETIGRKYYSQALKDFFDHGVLLVRVRSFDREIAYYEKQSGEKRREGVERVTRKREKLMHEIQKAFSSFTICPVYFFYANHMQEMMAKNYTNLLSAHGEVQDFSDRRVYFMDSNSIPAPEMNSTISGFAVYDQDFRFLNNPFPGTVRKLGIFKFLGQERSYSSMVEILQRKMNDALGKMQGQ